MKVLALILFFAASVAAQSGPTPRPSPKTQPALKPQPQFIPDFLSPDYSAFFVVGEVKGRIVPARAILLRRPAFIEEARDAGVEGTVRVDIVIAPDGTVSSAKAVSGPEQLFETCEYAARNSRFLPPGSEVSGYLNYEFSVKKPNWFAVSSDLFAVSRMRSPVIRKAFSADWFRELEIADRLVRSQSKVRRGPALMAVLEKGNGKLSAVLSGTSVPKAGRDAAALAFELRQLVRARIENDPDAFEMFQLGEVFATIAVSDYAPSRRSIIELLRPFIDRPPKALPQETFERLRDFYDRIREEKVTDYAGEFGALLLELRTFDVR